MDDFSWEHWDLQLEMDHEKMSNNNNVLLENEYGDGVDDDEDDEFLREILMLQPSFSSENSESDNDRHHNLQNTVGLSSPAVIEVSQDLTAENSNNKNKNKKNNNIKQPRRSSSSTSSSSLRCSSPRRYILSFDNSTMTPATPNQLQEDPYYANNNNNNNNNNNKNKKNKDPSLLTSCDYSSPKLSCSKSVVPISTNSNLNENKKEEGAITTKRARSSSQTMDHIMAERKRRQELTERFIALSATIPGLTKTDKASILRAAIDYVKQLQERVQELEKQNKKRSRESVILVKKSKYNNNNNNNNYDDKLLLEESTIISSETRSSEDGGTCLPDVEARFMGKDVLIEIHCEKENGIEMKILNQLENLHLFVTGSSVLPFGNSALGITVIAKMGDSCEMTVNDVVTNLRQVFLKPHQNSHGL